MALVKARHQPYSFTVMQRFHFCTRTQKPCCSTPKTVRILWIWRYPPAHTSWLARVDQHLQGKLIAEPDPMFNKAFKDAEKEAMDLQDTPSTRVHQLGKATATKWNFRIPNPHTICQRQPNATNAEHTNRQIANFKMLNAIIAKRKDTLPKCATAKSKAHRQHRWELTTSKNDWIALSIFN